MCLKVMADSAYPIENQWEEYVWENSTDHNISVMLLIEINVHDDQSY